MGSTLQGHHVITVEDRSGDVDCIAADITRLCRNAPRLTHVIGISLGAHAVAHWAINQSHLDCISVCVLPAWSGPPDSTAALTGLAAREIKALGIQGTLRRITAASPATDVTRVLEMGWDSYTDDSLAAVLQAAGQSQSIDALDLVHLRGALSVVGWLGDPLHPAETARRWSAASHARLAMAAYPNVRLLQAAVRLATGLPGRPFGPRLPSVGPSPAPPRGP